MLEPDATGSGESAFEMLITGADVTVVVASGPGCGRASFVSMVQPVLVITVPLGSGLFTFTTSCTDPDAPVPTAPMFQVMTPPDSDPPAVAETKVVFAGSGSAITVPVALLVPTF